VTAEAWARGRRRVEISKAGAGLAEEGDEVEVEVEVEVKVEVEGREERRRRERPRAPSSPPVARRVVLWGKGWVARLLTVFWCSFVRVWWVSCEGAGADVAGIESGDGSGGSDHSAMWPSVPEVRRVEGVRRVHWVRQEVR
jgi:hypothetical protein